MMCVTKKFYAENTDKSLIENETLLKILGKFERQ